MTMGGLAPFCRQHKHTQTRTHARCHIHSHSVGTQLVAGGTKALQLQGIRLYFPSRVNNHCHNFLLSTNQTSKVTRDTHGMEPV